MQGVRNRYCPQPADLFPRSWKGERGTDSIQDETTILILLLLLLLVKIILEKLDTFSARFELGEVFIFVYICDINVNTCIIIKYRTYEWKGLLNVGKICMEYEEMDWKRKRKVDYGANDD